MSKLSKIKTIPFDAKMAKDIHDGKIKGRIVTKNNNPVRILDFELKGSFNIVYAELVEPNNEFVYICNETTNKLFIELPEETPKHEFKPFDKVLVRNGEGCWQCALFSHMCDRDDFPYFANDFAFEQCIPYEGNEHLVGTTDKPKEK